MDRSISKPSVLFVNYGVADCGVHQYGKSLYDALKNSERYAFSYIDVMSIEDLDSAVSKHNYSAILYNYHPQTLAFLKPSLPRRYRPIGIAIMHEMTQAESDSMTDRFFQHFVMGDPTLVENNPGVFKTGRLIRAYAKPLPALTRTPIIGSYGFPVGSKGFPRLVARVQQEFDEALIRLHIPANGIIDKDGSLGRAVVEECRTLISKPGIRLEASHDFKDQDGLQDFLAGNTVNAFHYDYLPVAGVSSSTDQALAVGRPIAVTKSIMFRHLHTVRPSICLEDTSLREIIANGTEPISHLPRLWSEENLVREYESILAKVLDNQLSKQYLARQVRPAPKTLNDYPDFDYKALSRSYRSAYQLVRRSFHGVRTKLARRTIGNDHADRAQGIKRLNRVLDNQAREQYQAVVKQLWALSPEIMVSKIPAANVQQAFVFDTVRRFLAAHVEQGRESRILSVGSYDDSASASLLKLGHRVEEIDPEVNGLDLEKFCALPSTVPGSYDVVLSTSVIEHVQDDERFLRQIADLLAPSGVAVLTCDFHNTHAKGDPVIPGDHRWYSQKDLLERVLPLLHDCELVDVPQWDCTEPDFKFLGYQYTFASLVFRKRSEIAAGVKKQRRRISAAA